MASTINLYRHHLRGSSCKAGSTLVIVLFCCFLLGKEVDGSSNEKPVYTGNIPSEDSQRISILIGKTAEEDEASKQERIIGINQDDGGGGGSTNATDGPIGSESTTSQNCGIGSKCCYQYTWPSDRQTIPAASNATCEYLKKKNKADEMACFDPLVFTRAGENQLGTPPDFKELTENAQRNNWNIFCPMADKSCVTYTYYSRDGSNSMTNQTKFCGIVTNTNTGRQITDGCHKEQADGYVREVCVCSRTLCNGQPSTFHSSHVGILIMMFITIASNVDIVTKLFI